MFHKFLLSAALATVAIFGFAAGNEFGNETLNYKVMYKWGLVNKQAGRATLSIKNVGDQYRCLLTARSETWADKFFKVRDTLQSDIRRQGFKPLKYTKIAHEGDEYKHDVVNYSYDGARTIGDCVRRKWDKKGNLKVNETRRLEAYGTTVDMLSSFYYMRGLDYEKWDPGHVIAINIYSGKQKELLTIKYLGIADVEDEGRNYRCYHIRFQFTGNGGKKTSDDMDAWITADARRIPVKLEGKLKVGTVRCFYTG